MRVSVCMTAYNQEKTIGQAIEGVLAQRTSFPIELLIADDCSIDGTSDVCREYAQRNPNIIRYERRDPNLGMMKNFITTLGECDGDYVAICEGDDYWTDESKLQQQVDLLETHPEFAMSSHNHFELAGDTMIPAYPDIKESFVSMGTADYLLHPHFQTSSYLIRKSALPNPFPDWYKNVTGGDYFLVLLVSLKGKIGFINKRMSAFRTHAAGATGAFGPLRIRDNFVKHIAIFNAETNNEFDTPIRVSVQRWNLVHKVYEPVGYFSKLGYLLRNVGFYASNFSEVGGAKLIAKYLLGMRTFSAAKRLAK